MLLRPYSSTSSLSDITVSGYDPFCTGSCTFVPHYITQNNYCWTIESCYSTGSGWPAAYGVAGININNYVAGPGSGTGTVSNITLDHVRSANNFNDGVRIYNAGGSPGFTDSVYGSPYACITGNSVADLVTSGSASGYNSYINSCA